MYVWGLFGDAPTLAHILHISSYFSALLPLHRRKAIFWPAGLLPHVLIPRTNVGQVGQSCFVRMLGHGGVCLLILLASCTRSLRLHAVSMSLPSALRRLKWLPAKLASGVEGSLQQLGQRYDLPAVYNCGPSSPRLLKPVCSACSQAVGLSLKKSEYLTLSVDDCARCPKFSTGRGDGA